MPSRRIAGPYGSYIASFLRNLHIVLHSSYINLHSHQQCKRVPFSLHSLQYLLFVHFLMMAILTWCEVILLCSFDLHFSNNEQFEHFFMHLLAIYTSLEKYLFRSSAHFLIGLFLNSWVDIELMIHLYILQINPLSVAPFALIFSHTKGCHFILFIASFAVQTLESVLVRWMNLESVCTEQGLCQWLSG